MGIKHTKVACITCFPDDACSEVKTSDWNACHTITGDVDFLCCNDIINVGRINITGNCACNCITITCGNFCFNRSITTLTLSATTVVANNLNISDLTVNKSLDPTLKINRSDVICCFPLPCTPALIGTMEWKNSPNVFCPPFARIQGYATDFAIGSWCGGLNLGVLVSGSVTDYLLLNGTTQTIEFKKPTIFPSFTNCSRPAACTVVAGTVIYNSSDGGLNVSTGSNWRGPSGGWVNT